MKDTEEIYRLKALVDLRNSPGFPFLMEEITKLVRGAESAIDTAGKDMEATALAAAEFRAYRAVAKIIDSRTMDAVKRIREASAKDPAFSIQAGGVGRA